MALATETMPRRIGRTLSMLVLAVAIGVVESVMARLRLIRVPQLLVAAMILTGILLDAAGMALRKAKTVWR